jgi:hypothetical protein
MENLRATARDENREPCDKMPALAGVFLETGARECAIV